MQQFIKVTFLKSTMADFVLRHSSDIVKMGGLQKINTASGLTFSFLLLMYKLNLLIYCILLVVYVIFDRPTNGTSTEFDTSTAFHSVDCVVFNVVAIEFGKHTEAFCFNCNYSM